MPNASGGFYFEDLTIGQKAQQTRTITEADILAFGAASGDFNPIHFDAESAETSIFKGRIAHGMLVGSHFSALLGMRLPGPGAIYLSQTLEFLRPVVIGASVRAQVEVAALDEKKPIVVFKCEAFIGKKICLRGEARVEVARRPSLDM